MKAGFTRIAIILDRSGSMESVREATITGFNEFIRNQRALPGEARVSLLQFDDQHETVFSMMLPGVPELTSRTFVPRGSTALLDAQGRTIVSLGAELDAMPENERPQKVIVMTLTDGQENASKEFTEAKIAAMVKEQRDKYGWEFIYLGANQDAIKVAAGMGIMRGSTMTYAANPMAVKNTMYAASNFVGMARGMSVGTQFTDEDRASALVDEDGDPLAPPVA